MIELVKKNCIEDLKLDGSPIIIVAVVKEAEAIAKACAEKGIKVSAFCDSEKENLEIHFVI